MPIINWPFRSGVGMIAGCWALSSTQRMFSYMARYHTPDSRRLDQRVPQVLDMVRRARLEAIVGSGGDTTYPEDSTASRQFVSRKLPYFSVFPVAEGSLNESRLNYQNGLWNGLTRGYEQTFNGHKVSRNFRAEIEANQTAHFFRFGNVGMGIGTGVRSESTNRKTLEQLTRNLDGRRLTLINLRAGRTYQHVVMAKSYKRLANGLIEIKVYDSNHPVKDATVFFSNKAGHFYAPEIIERFAPGKGSNALGVFIVDEEERTAFESAMLAYYKALCR